MVQGEPVAYAHRNGEQEYPTVVGFYWWESVEHGWLSMKNVSPQVVAHHEKRLERGEAHDPHYRYYGPIPEPRKENP